MTGGQVLRIFDYSSYEEFFKTVLEVHKNDRGYKSQLAKAIQVHPSYITRILSGTASITPDQASALADFWNLGTDETEYFIWLVLKGRAGDPALKKLAEQKLKSIKKDNDQLGKALSAEKIEINQDGEYYLSWIYSAIHMLLTLPKEQTIPLIAQRLCIPESVAQSAVLTLEKIGLIEFEKNGKMKATKKNIHLSNQSWMAALQHKNWRIAASERIGRPGLDDVHYSGVHSISKKDLEKLRRQIREFLIQVDETVRPSPEETVCVMCLDLFEI